MQTDEARDNVAKTAHLTAWVRSLGRLSEGQVAANGDYLADRFLFPPQGAGFDSRPLRFAQQLARTRVFEVDMPEQSADEALSDLA